MKQAYLFVHFREKTTPDGEQVYFSVSKDGFNWEELNQGKPVLWTFYGDKGVRDFTVTRCRKTCKNCQNIQTPFPYCGTSVQYK